MRVFLDLCPDSQYGSLRANLWSIEPFPCEQGLFTLNGKEHAMIGRAIVAVVLAMTFAVPVFAGPKDTPGVDRREHRQKQRIKEGVRSGELTREEAKGLRREQREIRAKERAMRSDGVVTREERKELRQDLNEASKHIAEEKHDAERR
ncbi:MAG: hypothetical protein AABZ22_01520 [Nitrospirota bacterium]